MIVLFVGYLIVPLVVIGLSSMTGTMNSINTGTGAGTTT